MRNNPEKYLCSIGGKEIVEFDIEKKQKGREITNGTRPGKYQCKAAAFFPNRIDKDSINSIFGLSQLKSSHVGQK